MKVHKRLFVGDKRFSATNEYGYPLYHLITSSQEIKYIMNTMRKSAKNVGFMLVRIGDGDYEEIWVGESSIPYTWERVKRIK